ncbi:MAG: YggT family protein [Clostridia bacterium]|nr:YggT family protein [Clostridia bacterium]
MYILIELIRCFAVGTLVCIQTAMLLRAILSWFMLDGNRFINFLHSITEPFIYPVRRLMQKMNWLQGSPIDFSFMLTYLIISMLTIFLG